MSAAAMTAAATMTAAAMTAAVEPTAPEGPGPMNQDARAEILIGGASIGPIGIYPERTSPVVVWTVVPIVVSTVVGLHHEPLERRPLDDDARGCRHPPKGVKLG